MERHSPSAVLRQTLLSARMARCPLQQATKHRRHASSRARSSGNPLHSSKTQTASSAVRIRRQGKETSADDYRSILILWHPPHSDTCHPSHHAPACLYHIPSPRPTRRTNQPHSPNCDTRAAAMRAAVSLPRFPVLRAPRSTAP